MPCTSWSLSANACITGSKLAKVPGSACSTCYAMKDAYTWSNPQTAMRRRLRGLSDPRWIEAMTTLLLHYHSKPYIRIDLGMPGVRLQISTGNRAARFRKNPTGHHRWFDSGDLQSIEHLSMICEVASHTPKIKHWLATQELGMVRRYVDAGGLIPDNLVIRISSVMVDEQARRAWPHTSSVFTSKVPDDSHDCPARYQGHFCGSCRACWNPAIAHIAYSAH